MKLFEFLNSEICEEANEIYAPYYYQYLGYIQDIAAKPAFFRANGIYSLFTETRPVILKSEMIVGNKKGLYTQADKSTLEYAKKTVDYFGERTFITNKDHFAPNYEHILQLGLPGLIDEIDASLVKHKGDHEKCDTLSAMKRTLVGFSQMIKNYAQAAFDYKNNPDYDNHRLEEIIENCNAIVAGKPHSFAQALQLVWFCHTAFLMEGRYAMALGRMDQYLYPFYKADIEKGCITDEKVIELLENVFIKLQDDIVNICIGGQNKNGECEINALSRCILKAVGNCNVPGPNLSLRLTENTPDDFLDDCLKTIGTGLGYPALMNDDVNIAALKKYGYAEEDIYNYSMVGCIENFITGMQPPWSDGRFDTPRYFDYVFNNGISKTNGTLGLDTGDIKNINSMQEFMTVFEKQLAFGAAEYCANFNKFNNSINQAYYPEPFLSCFCYDCIGRGLDINNGGSKYPSVHGAAVMGIGTTADSLAAIEKIIFIDKKASLQELKDALNSNFEGYEELHRELLNAPKYGNNDDFVDKYAVWFIDYLGTLFDKYKTRDGGGIYIAAAANTSNIYAGKVINATPDGRKRGEPLSDAASPTYGKDVRGVTATINSISKPDYTKVACGSVINQKFSPSAFTDGKRQKISALIRTYFKKGGQEIQINATSREILQKAMEEPEKYKNLVVRVSGFSAFYVTLDKAVQLDILNRTQQE
jgi:formate C-acetyltransferase